MVTRTLIVHDSANFVVTSSSSSAIVGNGVINNSDTPNGTIFDFTAGSARSVTLDDTGGSPNIFNDDDEDDHVITDGAGLVADGQNVEAESLIFVRAINDAGTALTGPTITLTVFSQGGVVSDVWGFASNLPLEDGVSYFKTSGNNLGSSNYNSFVTCFAKNTEIDTPTGPQPIECLNVGDLVQTHDNGAMPIRWIGHRRVLARGAFAPIHIPANVLNNPKPLMVSPEHRLLINGPIVDVLFGVPEVLVAAKLMVGLSGISQAELPEIEYFHLLFDGHQIIKGGGCWSESFFLAENSISALDFDARQEILTLFPEIPVAIKSFGDTARTVLRSYEAALLKSKLQDAQSSGKSTAAA